MDAGSEILLFNRNLRGSCSSVCLFVGLSMATITGKPPGVFMRPACPTCGSRMLLVRIFPDKPGHDQHTYECPRCADEITEIVQSVKADAFH
jgi:DNA-directed RNA polymerase subunit RPC12/RpoP